MVQALYLVLAILGLSFLVFIHELGHYLVAKYVGMKVEAFSIGFGRPIISWMRNGVRWQIGILPFGGYVKIAGMEPENGKQPHEIEGGFFAKKPLDRILVALAGPVVNIAFAFLAFTAIWTFGGRQKTFSEYTQIIGLVDENSQLAKKGIAPGDMVTTYNNEPYTGMQDLLKGGVVNGDTIEVGGEKVDYATGKKTAYSYTVPLYKSPLFFDERLKTSGILAPASYLLFQKGQQTASVEQSGIAEGDRILSADGKLLFSLSGLSELLQEQKALLTVKRGNSYTQLRVPRITLSSFHDEEYVNDELFDLKSAASVQEREKDPFFIPYQTTENCVVVKPLRYLEAAPVEDTFSNNYIKTGNELQKGDVIVACDGMRVSSRKDLFARLQTKHVVLIVQKNPVTTAVPVVQSDEAFMQGVDWKSLEALSRGIGTPNEQLSAGSLQVLRPIETYTYGELVKKQGFQSVLTALEKKAASSKSSSERGEIEKQLKAFEGQYVVGAVFADSMVLVNPTPLAMMKSVLGDMWKTLSSVLSGQVSAKWMSGPVGIMQVMHVSWSKGFKEALFWLGMISMNLGILNLLPLPVLDGGHIVLSVFEMVTRRRISAKTMQKVILPFALLLIAFFVYVTYQDILRMF